MTFFYPPHVSFYKAVFKTISLWTEKWIRSKVSFRAKPYFQVVKSEFKRKQNHMTLCWILHPLKVSRVIWMAPGKKWKKDASHCTMSSVKENLFKICDHGQSQIQIFVIFIENETPQLRIRAKFCRVPMSNCVLQICNYY